MSKSAAALLHAHATKLESPHPLLCSNHRHGNALQSTILAMRTALEGSFINASNLNRQQALCEQLFDFIQTADKYKIQVAPSFSA